MHTRSRSPGGAVIQPFQHVSGIEGAVTIPEPVEQEKLPRNQPVLTQQVIRRVVHRNRLHDFEAVHDHAHQFGVPLNPHRDRVCVDSRIQPLGVTPPHDGLVVSAFGPLDHQPLGPRNLGAPGRVFRPEPEKTGIERVAGRKRPPDYAVPHALPRSYEAQGRLHREGVHDIAGLPVAYRASTTMVSTYRPTARPLGFTRPGHSAVALT